MDSLHDVADEEVTAYVQQHELRVAMPSAYEVQRVLGTHCIRCYVRGVELDPVLEMCDACCVWEGVK